ncbi:hypothetical protein R3Q06_36225, partial [Rhodococcus erythropolis]|uniref:hypothetical protein n=1 Tax=Rhodococcus erythropolis TaxID=1833 RepID=UPI00294A214F
NIKLLVNGAAQAPDVRWAAEMRDWNVKNKNWRGRRTLATTHVEETQFLLPPFAPVRFAPVTSG